jgi:arylsulfatase A-like enzyme
VSLWKNQEENDARLVDEMERWLNSNRQGRIFVWLHLLSPHRPYEPPRRFRAPGGRDPSSLYDGEVRYVDELIGRVIRAIDLSIGLESALLVFTSDHGEEFGEHGSEEHGHSLHNEVTWVPLIIAGDTMPAGVTVDTRVSIIDIMPTLLEAVGAESSASAGLLGTSLYAAIARATSPRDAYMEGMLYGSTERALIVDEYKIMFDEQGGSHRLYDTKSDPSEMVDLADRHPSRTRELGAKLKEMHERLEAERSVRFPALDDAVVSDEERERLLRAMRALGYINE